MGKYPAAWVILFRFYCRQGSIQILVWEFLFTKVWPKIILNVLATTFQIDSLSICYTFDGMNMENKVEELQAKVDNLTNDIHDCREEISMLKKEIAGLQLKRTAPAAPVQKTNSFTLENFVGLKLIHFVGIIVLIIGLTIGVKYAININLISAAVRIILAYIAGAILFLVSLRLRKKYGLFSAILFSGAMASAYFTTYAAFIYYAMLPRTAAFGIMLLFTLFTVYNALKYGRPEIAMLGLVGAYGIPFFVRGNSENITGLFSYILFINLGVVFLSVKKYWLSLNYLSFFTTWIIYFSCLYLDRDNKYYSTELLFAFAFYIIFLVSTLGFKLYSKYPVKYSDSTIIILNSGFLYFALSIVFAKNDMVVNGTIALVFAITHLVAALLLRKVYAQQKFLSNAFFSVGIVALISYFPLGYDGFTITIIWVILAIVMFVAGMYYKLRLFRFAAMFLFAFTLLKLLFFDSSEFSSPKKVIAYIFTGTVLLVVSFLYQRFKERIFDNE